MYIRMFVFGAAMTAAMAAQGANLAVHYRADDAGFVTNASGKVTKIVNQGTLGSNGDLYPTAMTPTTTVAANAFGAESAFRFDGTESYRSASDVQVYPTGGLGMGGAYFVVSRSNLAGTDGRNHVPFGHGANAARHGYFIGGNGFSPYFYNVLPTPTGTGGFSGINHDLDTDLVTVAYCKRQSTDTKYSISAWRRGLLIGSRSGLNAVESSNSKLVLGGYCTDIFWAKAWNGDIAEVRFYTGGLTVAEYYRVTCELAATYGFAVSDTNYPCSHTSALLTGFKHDPAAMGTASGLLNAETAATSATSGALTLEALDAVSAADSLVYLAHDGAAGTARKWVVAATDGAKGARLRFMFTGSAFAAFEQPVLAYRPTCAAKPVEVGSAAVVAGDTVTFTLPTGWANGVYCLAEREDVENAGLAVWFRADTGVTTNADGKVTAWTNQGELGSTFDLVHTNTAAPAVAVVENAFGTERALHFDNTDHLRSATKASLDFGSTGGAMFVVLNERSYSGAKGYGVIGLSDPDDATAANRFGLMSGRIDSTMYLRFFVFNGANYIDHSPMVIGNQLAAFSRFGTTALMDYTGDGTLVSKTAWTPTTFDGVFSVGNFHERMGNDNNLDVAEVRVYNEPLTSYRYQRIRAQLSARYRLPFNGADFSGCAGEPSTFGDMSARGLASTEAAAFATGTTCGALTVQLGATPESSADTFTAVVSNGKSGPETMWCIAAGADARTVPLMLTFDGAAFATPGVELYYRDTSGWSRTSAATEIVGDTLVCTLPAGWKSGWYRACSADDITAADCDLWFRADKGVLTDANGKVTGWKNSGSLGSGYDITHAKILGDATATSTIQYETACTTLGDRPALRFVDGKNSAGKAGQYLTSPTNVVAPFSTEGHTMFAVIDVEDSNGFESFFGLDDGGTNRFGLQTAPTWLQRYWSYCYYTSGTAKLFVRPTNGPEYWQKRFLLSATAAYRTDVVVDKQTKTTLTLFENGLSQYATVGNYIACPFADGLCKVSVGAFIGSWGAAIKGRIAELRYYNRPLTVLEITRIELELSARYGLSVATAGATDPAFLATHDRERMTLGNLYRRGKLTETVSSWTDGTLTATLGAFALDASASNTIAVVAHDGAAAEFVQVSEARKQLARTYLVASQAALPMTLRFATGTLQPNESYRLALKANGSTSFARLPVAGVQDGNDVVFDFPEGIVGGVYQLQKCKPAGMVMVLR